MFFKLRHPFLEKRLFFPSKHTPTDREGLIQGVEPGVCGWDHTSVCRACSLARLSAVNMEQHPPLPLQTCVLHMCSLFHAFIFAQLWTVYCEQSAVATNVQNQNEFSFTAILTALEFWSRVTPSILQLMAHNKVVSPWEIPKDLRHSLS